jgi:hypothetical protein
VENSGVVVDVKNVMAISSIPIMLDDDISVELVELAMGIPHIVAVGAEHRHRHSVHIHSCDHVVRCLYGSFRGVFAIRRRNRRGREREN